MATTYHKSTSITAVLPHQAYQDIIVPFVNAVAYLASDDDTSLKLDDMKNMVAQAKIRLARAISPKIGIQLDPKKIAVDNIEVSLARGYFKFKLLYKTVNGMHTEIFAFNVKLAGQLVTADKLLAAEKNKYAKANGNDLQSFIERVTWI